MTKEHHELNITSKLNVQWKCSTPFHHCIKFLSITLWTFLYLLLKHIKYTLGWRTAPRRSAPQIAIWFCTTTTNKLPDNYVQANEPMPVIWALKFKIRSNSTACFNNGDQAVTQQRHAKHKYLGHRYISMALYINCSNDDLKQQIVITDFLSNFKQYFTNN